MEYLFLVCFRSETEEHIYRVKSYIDAWEIYRQHKAEWPSGGIVDCATGEYFELYGMDD